MIPKRLTLQLRLVISVVIIIALFSTTVATYYWSSYIRNKGLENLRTAVAGQLSTVSIRQLIENQQKEILVLDTLRTNEAEKLTQEEIKSALTNLSTLQRSIENLGWFANRDPQASNSYSMLLKSFNTLSDTWEQFYKGFNVRNTPSIYVLQVEFSNLLNMLADIEAQEIQAAESQTRQIQSNVAFTDRVTMLTYLAALAIMIGLGTLLIKYTNRSLSVLKEGTVQIGGGDLDHHIPIKNDDEIGDLTMAFNEMTAKLRNAMAQVRQSKENADRANRSKTNFLANMSHELRTPLNAIIGYSEMIVEEYKEKDTLNDEQTIGDVQRILVAGRQLLQLINDVLDLAKIESGNMTLFKQRFDSIDILKGIIDTLQPMAKKSNNRIKINYAYLPPQMDNDEIKFRQLFLNLLSNSCKFTENGNITIDVTHDKASNHLLFKVSDTGIGMTPQQLKQIFKAFVQADSSTSTKYGGTGLGLSISKQFVELMGGKIDVESEAGVGTTFSIWLPIDDSKEPSALTEKNQQELNFDARSFVYNNPEETQHNIESKAIELSTSAANPSK